MKDDDIQERTSFILKNLDEKQEYYDMSKTNARFVILFFACFICFGSYFVYDSPTSIQKELERVIKYIGIKYR